MEAYNYSYPSAFNSRQADNFPDHGDGFGDYYDLNTIHEDKSNKSRSKTRTARRDKRSRSRTSQSDRSQSRSRSVSHSRSRSHSHSRSHSATTRELKRREPSFLDAFRILYLKTSSHKKSTTKYLSTKKRLDRVQDILKRDGLGSKRWLFYPRSHAATDVDEVPDSRENCDQRIKVDGHFFRKYKHSKKIDRDAPIAKLKRWELIFYKKLGFIQAV
ncbi:uncharacterized protein DDB_G0287625-like isoform X2 [Leptidea sinapis]|uniref:uncharacterized protein DDB_G0287625-like isoform X2 n=1 Tax=Leptidea sinapis TaxID=189913 RepID=UPI0021C2F63A|nr:uncharacterized protein DDB_G0287625-like isoform X2 [Leptidea sinapis]